MRKILLGTALALFCANLNASCEDTTAASNDIAASCEDSKASFSGVFLGAGAVVSYDMHIPAWKLIKKKNAVALGGAIVLGYNHQFNNGFLLGIEHNSFFLSKGAVKYKGTVRSEDITGTLNVEIARKLYSPSVGINIGYVKGNCAFGIRTGIAIEKFDISGEAIVEQGGERHTIKGSIDAKQTSPYLGAFVEYRKGKATLYANVTGYLGKKGDKVEVLADTVKHPSVKLNFGVKFYLNSVLNKSH